MARLIISSVKIGDSSDAVEVRSADLPRLLSLTFKARASNVGGVFLANDSSAKSEGYEVQAGDREYWPLDPVSVKGSGIWVWGSDSGDRLDYALLLED